jgi:multicomponent Na+:H+ antiporter subunit C
MINVAAFYTIGGVVLFTTGLYALIVYAHLLRKILALNVCGSGVFLCLVATANRTPEGGPDTVPHAMVLTGIVVAVSATALALALTCHFQKSTGRTTLSEDEQQ